MLSGIAEQLLNIKKIDIWLVVMDESIAEMENEKASLVCIWGCR